MGISLKAGVHFGGHSEHAAATEALLLLLDSLDCGLDMGLSPGLLEGGLWSDLRHDASEPLRDWSLGAFVDCEAVVIGLWLRGAVFLQNYV